MLRCCIRYVYLIYVLRAQVQAEPVELVPPGLLWPPGLGLAVPAAGMGRYREEGRVASSRQGCRHKPSAVAA